ncbi:hypothetical protein BROUX41_005809 [Berkeleyomyces rouxiae]
MADAYQTLKRFHPTIINDQFFSQMESPTVASDMPSFAEFADHLAATAAAITSSTAVRFYRGCQESHPAGQHTKPSKKQQGNKPPAGSKSNPYYVNAIDKGQGTNSPTLRLNSDATTSTFSARNMFTDYQEQKRAVSTFGGGNVWALGHGKLELIGVDGNKIYLENVLHVPNAENIISFKSINAAGLTIDTINPTDIPVVRQDHNTGNKTPVLKFIQHNDKWICNDYNQEHNISTLSPADPLLHEKWGHPGRVAGERIAKSLGQKYEHPEHCTTCIQAKTHETPGHGHIERGRSFLDKIHIDTVGKRNSFPSDDSNQEVGPKYFMIIVDGATSFVWVRQMKSKTDAYKVMRAFLQMCKTQHHKTPKRVHSDRGTELIGSKMEEIYQEFRTIAEPTAAYAPQQNGIAERMVRTITEKARALYLDS